MLWLDVFEITRFQVSDYNSILFKINSQLMLCEEKVIKKYTLEKIFTTFHASNGLL